MNRNNLCRLASWACVLPLVLSGCKGNPFAYRDSLLRSRAPGGQSEPNTETVESSSRNSATKTQARHEEETDIVRAEAQRLEDTNEAVVDLMLRAEEALATGDQKKAAEIYQEVVQLQPTHKGALHRLAILFDKNGNFTRAESYFRRALEFAPDDPTLLNDIGYAYLRQQRLEDSEHFLRESMNIDPSNQITLRNIGILLALQGNPGAAQEFFHRGGLSDEEAHQEYAAFLSSISMPGTVQHLASIDELSKSQNTPTASGQFAPPDLEATYGLKSESPERDAERNSYESHNQQNVAGNSEQFHERVVPRATIDQQDRMPEGTSRIAAGIETGSGYSNYDLERAALNAGPGSLFPIAALNRPTQRQPHLRAPYAALQEWSTVQPAGFGEPDSTEERLVPPYYSRPSRVQDSPFIQSPPDRASESYPRTEDSTGAGFPVTQQISQDPTRINPSYYQFPGTSARTPSSESTEYDYSATTSPGDSGYR